MKGMRRKSSKTAEAKKHRALPARAVQAEAAYSTPPRKGPSRPVQGLYLHHYAVGRHQGLL